MARDDAKRNSISKNKAKTKTKAFIQIVHRFRDAAVSSSDPPLEKVAIFDEAQRAWDMEQLTKFMAQKKGVPDFNKSEPESLIEFMNRHDDWATIVCLVYSVVDHFMGENIASGWPSLMSFMSIGFFGVFALLTIVLKYLSVLLNLVFRQQRYMVADIEKIVGK